MTKSECIKWLFDQFNNDLDNVFERFKIKYILLKTIKDHNLYSSPPLQIQDDSGKNILEIGYLPGQISKYYDQMEIECRRIYISDLYSDCAHFCIYIRNILDERNINGIYLPAFMDKKFDQPFTLINKFLKSEDRKFLEFLHNFRNSMIHYHGQYNKRNNLNYKLLSLIFKTTDKNLGQQIMWGMEEIVELYKKLKNVFQYDKFAKNGEFQRMINNIDLKS